MMRSEKPTFGRVKYLIFSTVALCLVILFALGWAVIDARDRTVKFAFETTIDAGRMVQRQIMFVFDLGMSVLTVEGSALEARFRAGFEDAPGTVDRFIAFQNANPIMSRMGAFDAKGHVIATSIRNLPPEFSVSKRPEFIRHAAGEQGPLFTPVTESAVTGKAVILISKRLNRPDGSFGGDIKIGFDYDILNSYLRELTSKNFGSRVQLIDLGGTVILDSNSNGPPIPERLEPEAIEAMAKPDGSPMIYRSNDGRERIWLMLRVGNYPLFLRVGTDCDSVKARWLNDGLQYGVSSALAIAALLFLGSLAFFFARGEEHSLQALRLTNMTLEQNVAERTKSLTEKSDALETALKERTVLFQEIHHRIKNSLQVIASLVSLSSKGNTDPSAQMILDEIARRIRAIGQVHQTLYEQNALEHVDLNAYLTSLINSEREVYGAKERGIEITITAEGELNLDTAVSVGLIVSEAVANSFKYAFGSRQNGKILIEASVKDGKCHVSVTDDGVGFPKDVKDGTGMMIIKTIAKQRKATLRFREGPGGGIVFDFAIGEKA